MLMLNVKKKKNLKNNKILFDAILSEKYFEKQLL
jgi:hypothetical protein